jgi:hypothetical protein
VELAEKKAAHAFSIEALVASRRLADIGSIQSPSIRKRIFFDDFGPG